MDSVESWFKPLEDGGWAVCFVNRSRTSRKISFDWNRDKVHDELSSRNLDLTGTGYRIKDLWNRTSLGNTSSVLKAEVPPHDVLMVKLSK
jgi:alpha-galactosidase